MFKDKEQMPTTQTTNTELTTEQIIRDLKMFRSLSLRAFGWYTYATFYVYRCGDKIWSMSEFSASRSDRTFYPLSNFSTDQELEAVAVLLAYPA